METVTPSDWYNLNSGPVELTITHSDGRHEQLTLVDFGDVATATLANGVLTVNSGPSGHAIDLAESGTDISVTVDGLTRLFNASSVNSILVRGSDGNDRVTIRATPADVPVTVDGGGGDDTLTVDDSSESNPSGGTYLADPTHVYRDGAAPITYSAIEGLTLYASNGNNTIDIGGTAARTPVTVYGGRGDDKFFVGTYNGFYSLPADVTVYGGGGTDTMAVEDITPPFIPPDIPPPSDVYTITATTVSRSNAAKVTYSDLVGVSLNVDGSRGDTYNVVSTPYATPVTLTAGNGENIFNISPKDHSLDNIQGALTIVSVGGDDTLNVDDSANTIDRHVALNVTGDGPQRWGTISGRAVADIAYACNSTSSVYVMTGTAADTVNILATATPVYLNSRDGQDVVNVGNAGSVQGILGKLTIDNQRSKTTLNVDDSADTVGRMVTLTTSGGGHQPWGTISGLAPADIVYKVGRASVTLGGGTGDDTFAFSDARPSPGRSMAGEGPTPWTSPPTPPG